jgi:hypothetical protein
MWKNNEKENLEMNEKDFILWLRGFADAVGTSINPKQWEFVLKQLEEVRPTKQPIHGGFIHRESGGAYETKEVRK